MYRACVPAPNYNAPCDTATQIERGPGTSAEDTRGGREPAVEFKPIAAFTDPRERQGQYYFLVRSTLRHSDQDRAGVLYVRK